MRPLSVGNLHRLPHRRQGARAKALGDHHAARLQRMAHMHQRAGQVVERVERAETQDVAVGARVGLLFVELVRARALDIEPARLKRRCQLPGYVADDERGARFGAGEVEALDDVLDHVVENEACGVGCALPGKGAVIASPSALGREDVRDGPFGHGACLHGGTGAA